MKKTKKTPTSPGELFLQIMEQNRRLMNGMEPLSRLAIRDELGWTDQEFDDCARHLITNERYCSQLTPLMGQASHEFGIRTLSELSKIYWIPIDSLRTIESEIWAWEPPRKLSKETVEKLKVRKSEDQSESDWLTQKLEEHGITPQHRRMMNPKCEKLLLKEPELFAEKPFTASEKSTNRAGVSYRFKPQTVDILKLAAAGTDQTITSFLEDLIKNYASEYMLGWIEENDQKQPRENVEGHPGATCWYRSDNARNAIKTYAILHARHGKGENSSMYFVDESGTSSNPMTPHGPKFDPFLLDRLEANRERPKYQELFAKVTQYLTVILTWMAGNQEIVGDLLQLQADMKEDQSKIAENPELFQLKMEEWYSRYVDLREAVNHIGEERVAKVPADEEPQTELFDPRD
jgi:Txe/YoeB family toxin of Txe-Axe toxin-antitoxin module